MRSSPPAEHNRISLGRVAILLSTYQGARYLPALLDSLRAQTQADWLLYWLDDHSTDASAAIVAGFAATFSPGRCVRVSAPLRLGALEGFLTLLRHVVREAPATIAFADQDDVWLPEKLARGQAALDSMPPETVALYCTRQILVDAALRRIGLSAPIRDRGFPAALTQNIATGCTVMLSPAAAALVAAYPAPLGTMHDWWSYLLVSACGGRVLVDDTPSLLYRQHGANTIGAPSTRLRRLRAALARGPRPFMRLLRTHVAALNDTEAPLTADARAALAAIAAALAGGRLRRLRLLALPGLRRQTAAETFLFRLWLLIG